MQHPRAAGAESCLFRSPADKSQPSWPGLMKCILFFSVFLGVVMAVSNADAYLHLARRHILAEREASIYVGGIYDPISAMCATSVPRGVMCPSPLSPSIGMLAPPNCVAKPFYKLRTTLLLQN